MEYDDIKEKNNEKDGFIWHYITILCNEYSIIHKLYSSKGSHLSFYAS